MVALITLSTLVRRSPPALALLTLALLTLGLLAGAGCVRDSSAFPCSEDDRCLERYACVEGQCIPCEGEACPTSRVTLVSTTGGLACGADEMCVRFVAGALGETVEVEVGRTREEATNFPDDERVSKLYAVKPVFVVPRSPVEITMMVSRSVVPAQRVRIYTALEPRGPWSALETARAGQRLTATAPALGYFTIALDQRPAPELDGGVVEQTDSGPPPPLDPVRGIGQPLTIPGGVLRSLHGVAWDATTSRLLLTDTDTSEIFSIVHTDALPQRYTRFRTGSSRTFGVTVDGLGQVYMAEHGSRTVTQLQDRAVPVAIASAFEGQRFNGPSDVAVRTEGTVYFTDPTTGLGDQPRDLDFTGLFRRTPAGALTAEWRGTLGSEPRGLELSPDESRLYLTDTSSQAVLVFDVSADGTLSGARTFARTEGLQPDGIAVDRVGNVYVGTQSGIEVYAPDGTPWGRVATETPVGGLAFGGPLLLWLYAASPDRLLLMTVTVSGAR